jgi:outer membrane immunogenic protein
MQKIIFKGAAVLALAITASAPASAGPAYGTANWSGFYVGVNGGYGWNAGNMGNNVVDVCAAGWCTPSAITTNVPVAAPSANGGFGGGQLGYNVQSGHAVFGIEADIQGSGISGKSSSSFGGSSWLDPYSYSAKYNLDYFGTVRGRLGLAFDSTLLYATGGFAYGGISYSGAATFTPSVWGPAFDFKKSATDTGYVVGGGVEHKFSPVWSVKAEYQYINLGTEQVSGAYYCCSGYNNTLKFDNSFHTLRVGLNYQLSAGGDPLK